MKSATLWLSLCLLSGLAAPSFSAASKAPPANGAIDYNRDIRPILADTCFACHGPDSAARKADLRLDSFATATASRGDDKPAIVPGKPDESGFIARIETSDEDDLMPPPKTKKVLTAEQKKLLRDWVASGAEYQAHWSLLPPRKTAPPETKNKRWVQTPVDAFVLARLESEGLKPADEADRATLARRVSLDLTGLPPTPEMVQRFLEDKSPDAYERFVDMLLDTPAYGEHRARYWLDAARYADTHGIHIDNYREIWAYREWVIKAFNRNMPFDQFTVEQLAGDLLPNPTLEQKIATGFNRCNITTSEGGAINEEYFVLYTRDRTETTSAVWLGLTTGCATCHDHKYDPISQKEFYSLAAFFNNTTQPAMDGNRKDTPPVITVPAPKDRTRWEELPDAKKSVQSRLNDRREHAKESFATWVKEAKPATILQGLPTDKLDFVAPLTDGEVESLSVFASGFPMDVKLQRAAQSQPGVIAEKAFTTSKENAPVFEEAGNFERDQPFSIAFWMKLDPEDRNGSIIARMDEDDGHRGWDVWLQDGRPGIHMVHKWSDDALKVVSRKAVEPNQWTHIAIAHDGTSKADGISIYINGERQDMERPNNKLTKTIRTRAPFKIGQRKNGDHVEKAGVQDIRFYSKALSRDDVNALRTKPRLAYLVAKAERTEDEQNLLYNGYLAGYDDEFVKATTELAALDHEEREIKARGTIAHVMNEKPEPAKAFVLFRGEYDKRRDEVPPATPKALPEFPADLPKNRLGFAQWLLLPEHPLTTRVTVNRMWQELFGVGLVRTAGDFGITGELPSNQALLDWLAVEFRESGWNVKNLYKTLVMSAAYRQSAVTTPEKLAKDPDNRLISRGPRFRMDAEMIRDYALAVSGLMVPKIGGPSVKPYQPEGVWEMVAMPESDTRFYKQDSGDNLYRRSLYTFWKRTAPPASLDVLNAPNRETCAVLRERTNTPLQALATLNDTQLIEAARHLAERTLVEGGPSEMTRLDFMAQRLLARPLRPEERKIVLSLLIDLTEHYKAAADEAVKLVSVGESQADPALPAVQLAAYTMVANQLLNLDEVLNK